jgi:hypothetical protein
MKNMPKTSEKPSFLHVKSHFFVRSGNTNNNIIYTREKYIIISPKTKRLALPPHFFGECVRILHVVLNDKWGGDDNVGGRVARVANWDGRE